MFNFAVLLKSPPFYMYSICSVSFEYFLLCLLSPFLFALAYFTF